MSRIPTICRLLISVGLVVSLLKQNAGYLVPKNQWDNQQPGEDSDTPEAENIDGSLVPDYSNKGQEPGYNDESKESEYSKESKGLENSDKSQLPAYSEEGQKPGHTNGRQMSENIERSQKQEPTYTSYTAEYTDMIKSQSNHIFTNQSDVRNEDDLEIASDHKETDREHDGNRSGKRMKQETEIVITKTLINANRNKIDLKAGSVNNNMAKDSDKHENEEGNAENREVIDIITAICGEQYQPCTQSMPDSRIFKASSICKTCSCNAKSCHISRNCCPDVQVETTDIDNDSAPFEVCATLSNVLSFTNPNREQGENDIMASTRTVNMEVESNSSKLNFTSDINKQELNISPKFRPSKTEKDLLGVGSNTSETETEKDYRKGSNPEKTVDLDHRKLQASNIDPKNLSQLATSLFPMYLVTETCPTEFQDANVTAKCEDKASSILTDHVPVSDWFTTNIYRNKWCAQCHNVSTPDKWRLVTDCLQLYTMDYLPSMVTDFYNLTKNCMVRVIPQITQRTNHKICQTDDHPISSIVQQCNVTKLWKQNVTIIEKLCDQRNYMAYYKDRSLGQETIYKNIFCYICNTNMSSQTPKDSKQTEKDFPFGETSLYMDINVEDHSEQSGVWFTTTDDHNLTCPAGQIPDAYTDDCMKFECPVHQTAMSNLCIDRHRDVTGLVLTSTIQLLFKRPVYVGITNNEISQSGGKVAEAIDTKLQITRQGCNIRYVKMHTNFVPPSKGYIQEMFLLYKIANTEKCSVLQVLSIYSQLNADITNINVHFDQDPKLPIYSLPQSEQNEPSSAKLYFKPLQAYEIELILIEKPVPYEIKLTEKFYCPRVLISPSKYTKLAKEAYLELTEDEKLHLYDTETSGPVPICYSDYLEHWLQEEYETKSAKKPERNSQTKTLSMISTIISMLSILIVLVTYCLFSELRFIPGKLLMVLCCNLLLAQGFYSFGIDLGVDNIWCQLVGVCIHMLWLATMFSMNSILFLISKSSKDPLGPKSRQFIESKSNLKVFKYSCYCYVISFLFVLANVVLSRYLNNDDHYGYGGALCYINTGKMIMFTFALPIAVVLLINFFLFTRIMSNISQLMNIKYNRAAKAHILIFLKLSTITGFYWSFGFIYEATDIKIFEYLFIVFSGGHGFFLMWSFLFNKHVMQLYKKLLKKVCLKHEHEALRTTKSTSL